jgi:dynein light chain 1, axonemal
LAGLPQLEVLSLGRNSIKKLEGLEPVAPTLKQLWISYNVIERLVSVLGQLRYRDYRRHCQH